MRGRRLVEELEAIVQEAGAEVVDSRFVRHTQWKLRRRDGREVLFVFGPTASDANRGALNCQAQLRRLLRA